MRRHGSVRKAETLSTSGGILEGSDPLSVHAENAAVYFQDATEDFSASIRLIFFKQLTLVNNTISIVPYCDIRGASAV